METSQKQTIEIDGATFEIEGVTAQRFHRGLNGNYLIECYVDGQLYSSSMNHSYLYDDLYTEIDGEEDERAQQDAIKAIATIIVRENQLV